MFELKELYYLNKGTLYINGSKDPFSHGLVFSKHSLPPQVEEQLASIDVVHDKVQLGVGLGVLQAHQERMVDIIEKHIPLSQGVFHFMKLNDDFLIKHLDSIVFFSLNVFHQVHLAREREREQGWTIEVHRSHLKIE